MGKDSATETVALVGASGVLGRALAPCLVDAGYSVKAISRHPPAAADGIEPVRGDILDADQMLSALKGCSVVIHAATAVPTPDGDGDWSLNDRIRRDGTANLLNAAAANGARCFIQQSIAMLLSVADDTPQIEDDPVAGTGVLASAVDMEALVQAAPLDWRIVRGGLFYGPGTGREDALRAAAQGADWRMPGDGSGWLAPVYIDDMASAMVCVLQHGAARTVYNASDDNPVTWREICHTLANRLGLELPPGGGPLPLPSFRVSNDRLRRLGWQPSTNLPAALSTSPD